MDEYQVIINPVGMDSEGLGCEVIRGPGAFRAKTMVHYEPTLMTYTHPLRDFLDELRNVIQVSFIRRLRQKQVVKKIEFKTESAVSDLALLVSGRFQPLLVGLPGTLLRVFRTFVWRFLHINSVRCDHIFLTLWDYRV